MIDPGTIAAITYSLNDSDNKTVEKYPLTKAVQRNLRKHCNKVTAIITIPGVIISILIPVISPVIIVAVLLSSTVYSIRYQHEFNSLQRKLGKDEFERQLQIAVDKNRNTTTSA